MGVVLSEAGGRLVEGNAVDVGAGCVVVLLLVVVVVSTVVVVASVVSVGWTGASVCGVGCVVGVGWLVVVGVSTVVAGSSVVEVDDSAGRDEVVESGTVEVTATVEELTLAP